MLVRKIAFVTYPAVKDFEKTRSFYTSLLGIKEGSSYSGKDEHGSWRWLEYDLPEGGCFVLSNMACAIPDVGCNVAFEVDNIDQVLEKLPKEAIKREKFHTEVCALAVVLDPEGNTVTLHKIGKKHQP